MGGERQPGLRGERQGERGEVGGDVDRGERQGGREGSGETEGGGEVERGGREGSGDRGVRSTGREELQV